MTAWLTGPASNSTIQHLFITNLLTRRQQDDNKIYDIISKCCDILAFIVVVKKRSVI